ncbi:Transcriptional regulator, MarR family [Thermobacillus xylanilyticus]|jgi:MarR family transcriptional regulator, organic hydroperoxide resistance regulator|uniref:Transcriptional regulator n=2 Tax=Thermobacillus TaxID=76632 RepID=L0EC42_THECK|nr:MULTISPECIES: MarR family transcriptional regulator [Thermobacillus]AGA57342.1 transcriptional regulator [Thermobacillus composti KWC4]REJ17020.1 MAG: MarR family transcriptional regulator [Paenibacillaceae bacterium]CAG5090800.1 Transcriptional regulator, MarR family [Thermobacillus xylanilyticus]
MADDRFLEHCLFFTANRLGRIITKIAEEEFAETGLTPMYGYLIRLAIGKPGISQKELAEKLSIASSTLTRFVDKLEAKKLVKRRVSGKTVQVFPTEKAIAMEEALLRASHNLHARLDAILGKETTAAITEAVLKTSKRLEQN